MGRPKTYDRDAMVAKAMELFWLHGFEATTTQMLVDRLGINRFSLYAEFGSKQGLYEASMDRYDQDVVTHHFGPLERPGASLPEIEALLRFFASQVRTPGSEHGCMLCNVATERAPHDPASHARVERYLGRIASALRSALQTAQSRNQLAPDVQISGLAGGLTTTFLGLFVLLRAQSDPAIARDAAATAIAQLHSLAAAPTAEVAAQRVLASAVDHPAGA
jgi:TetR/AcrR family transcriptional repressor of nem operon